jgi:hypothetical protein
MAAVKPWISGIDAARRRLVNNRAATWLMAGWGGAAIHFMLYALAGSRAARHFQRLQLGLLDGGSPTGIEFLSVGDHARQVAAGYVAAIANRAGT